MVVVVIVVEVVPVEMEVGVEEKTVLDVVVTYFRKEKNLANLVAKIDFDLEGSIVAMMLVDTKWKRGFPSVVGWPKVHYNIDKD
jgi:hypothetical protein